MLLNTDSMLAYNLVKSTTIMVTAIYMCVEDKESSIIIKKLEYQIFYECKKILQKNNYVLLNPSKNLQYCGEMI